MNFQETHGKSIQEAFLEFHQNNPSIYAYFKELAFKAIKSGKKRTSANMIMNVIRWEITIKPNNPTLFDPVMPFKNFKINDSFSSRYARLFIEDHPEHADKFELRELKS